MEKSRGNIVTISSVSGRDVDFTAPGPYPIMKAGLIHYTAGLAHTLASKGVRANTVSPGKFSFFFFLLFFFLFSIFTHICGIRHPSGGYLFTY